MKKQMIEAITSGLEGEWTHIDPKSALANLNPSKAKIKPKYVSHSPWELLHHIVIWQDALLAQIKGASLDWNEIEKKDNWPTSESMQDDSNFSSLLNRFHSGIEEAQELLKRVDFTNTYGQFPELSVFKLYLTLLQHTSYHLGQIVTIRKQLGDKLVG
ncbi:MAG: DinB family protein [Candidatus Hodarchaeales archaeon]|jgi:uncharacterized damage-inducible protein DinB